MADAFMKKFAGEKIESPVEKNKTRGFGFMATLLQPKRFVLKSSGGKRLICG
jgi:hypothetical protein